MAPDQPPPVWHGLAAGASSAIVSRCFTYPPDSVKARLQVQGAGGGTGGASGGGGGGRVLYSGTLDAFRQIARAEGLPGFYRGFGSILLTVIPANMCYFGAYEMSKRVTPRNLGMLSDMMTAVMAQTVAGVIYCPIDIVKQRVQTQGVMRPGSRISPLAAVHEVWANRGLPGFFKGFWAMNALWLPWNLIYISLYEESKRRIYTWKLRQLHAQPRALDVGGGGGDPAIPLLADPPMLQVLPLWAFPLCSASCAAVAAVATHPIDVVKTRLQVLSSHEGRRGSAAGSTQQQQQQHHQHQQQRQQHTASASQPALQQQQRQHTALRVARDLYAAEGVRGFARGMAARVLTISGGSAVSWFVYETTKRRLAQLDARRDAAQA